MVSAAQALVSVAVGAITGYITNVAAVWMLFHPKKPVRIPLLNITIQGVLVAKLPALAERLASVIHELVPPEEVEQLMEKALTSPNLRRALADAIEEKIRGALSRIPIPIPINTRRLAEEIANAIIEALRRNPELLRRAATALAESIDVAEYVKEKARQLDPDLLENLYRRIIAKELRFIEVSGAFLGAFVGLLLYLAYAALGLVA